MFTLLKLSTYRLTLQIELKKDRKGLIKRKNIIKIINFSFWFNKNFTQASNCITSAMNIYHHWSIHNV